MPSLSPCSSPAPVDPPRLSLSAVYGLLAKGRRNEVAILRQAIPPLLDAWNADRAIRDSFQQLLQAADAAEKWAREEAGYVRESETETDEGGGEATVDEKGAATAPVDGETVYERAHNAFFLSLEQDCRLQELVGIEIRQDRYKVFKECQEIVPGVLLSSEFVATFADQLAARTITHVVRCNQFGKDHPGIQYLKLKLRDCETEDAKRKFKEASLWISQATDEGATVLVHCEMGVSRSAAITIAHVMQIARIDFLSACALVRRLRPCTEPNPGFRMQLSIFEDDVEISPVTRVIRPEPTRVFPVKGKKTLAPVKGKETLAPVKGKETLAPVPVVVPEQTRPTQKPSCVLS